MRSKRVIEAIVAMPGLKHSTAEPFDIQKSDVVNWLVAQPAVRQWVFDHASSVGAIVFDSELREWRGNPEKAKE